MRPRRAALVPGNAGRQACRHRLFRPNIRFRGILLTHTKNRTRLVIVESPTKARTIRRFLPSGFEVEASMGHVRDLPASATEIPEKFKGQPWARLGVKVEDDFEPLYIITPKKRQVVQKLRSALKKAAELYIATDEDREGESIGWHLIELLKPQVPVHRMVFHEITEDAIYRALDQTRDIDRNLVDSQETRRVLDRLVGYTISPLLWKKIAPKLSAGRVQSVAVRLLVLREQQRLRFVPASYWDLKSELVKDGEAFTAIMTHLDGVRLASGKDFEANTGKLRDGLQAGRDVLLFGEAEARQLAAELQDCSWRVASVEQRQARRTPSPPFTTSTLQQEASRKLGLAAKQTMRIAQGLYEKGYITYMRTDSTHLAQEALNASRHAIRRRYGTGYLSAKPRTFTTRARNAQEAHEAIRPAGKTMRTRSELGLAGVEGALYDLIWKRTLATQMANARLKFVTARLEAQPTANGQVAGFRASGRTIIFPGFLRVYVEGSDDPEAALDTREQPLPDLDDNDQLECQGIEANGHETKAPARYTEASLVKLLEQEGIGRPSTYASIIDTIIQRGYARKSGNQLIPTFTAFATNNLLEEQFAPLVNTEFTANMEQALDDIAAGELNATPYLRDFYLGEDGIEARVERGLGSIDARAISTISSPKWDPYVIRVGRFGPYVEGKLDGESVTASLPDEIAPAEVTREMLEELLRNGRSADQSLGNFPGSDQAMLLRRGPYGPYLQLGEGEEGGKGSKPKRVSVPKDMDLQQLTPEVAAALLSLPRQLGNHPESGEIVEANIGRFGPYVRHQRTFASLPRGESVLEVKLEQALELLVRKEAKNRPLRTLGAHPESGEPIEIRAGRYGPYVKHLRTNASLAKGQDPEKVTLAEALELLAAREQSGAKTKRTPRGKASAKRSAGGRQRRSVGNGSRKQVRKQPKKRVKKQGAPKATAEELARFLHLLSPQDADVVRRLEGWNGNGKQDATAVAQELGLSSDEVQAVHKRGLFKLRMAFGRARKSKAGG